MINMSLSSRSDARKDQKSFVVKNNILVFFMIVKLLTGLVMLL